MLWGPSATSNEDLVPAPATGASTSKGDDGLSVALWNHRAARLRNAWEDWRRAVWKPRFHIWLTALGSFSVMVM
jgi:hypothetical protein